MGGVKIGSGVSVTADGTISVAAGAVTSVFGRAGAVVAQSGDYTAAQVGAVPTTRQIINGTGISGGGALSSDLTLSVVSDTTTQRIRVLDAGTLIGTRQAINFVDGSNITVTAADDSANNRVNVTVAATGLVPTSRQIINGTGITGGGDLSADRTLSVVADTTTQRLRISKAGTLTGTRQELNFIDGSNISITTADNSANNRVNVTIAATGLVPTSRQIINGTGITGGGDLSADRTLSVVADTTVQKVRFSAGGTLIGTRQEINFIQGSNVSLTIVDDAANNRVNLTIAAVSGGSQTPWTSNIDGAGFKLGNTSGIGIGVAADANRPLTIQTSAAVSFDIYATNSNATASGGMALLNDQGDQIQFGLGGSAVGSTALQRTTFLLSTRDVIFGVSSAFAERMRIAAATGNVGINQTNPAYKLDVTGDCNLGSGVYRINGVPLAASNITNAVDTTQTYANPAWISSLAWSKITGAPATGVSSVFGRSGAVVAASGDYTAAQVTNAVDTTGSYANPSWLTSLAWSKITGAPSVSSYQTPWLSDINGGGFSLSNTNNIACTTLSVQRTTGFSPAFNLITGGTAEIGLFHKNTSATGSAGIELQNDQSDDFRLMLGGSNAAYVASQRNVMFAAGPINAMVFLTGSTSSFVERMRITAAGRVGIAQSNPQYALDIIGDLNITGTYRVNGVPISTGGGSQTPWTQNIDGGGFQLNNAGRIGVGTSTPQTRIDSVGMIRTTDTNPVPTTGAGLEMFYDTTTPKGFIGAYDRGAAVYKRLEINGGPLTLQMNGQGVGIGTANPGATLHVVRGTDNIDVLLVSGAESNKYISFQSGPSYGTMFHWNGSGYGGIQFLGRVGVGAGAVHPTYPFQVTGGRSRFDGTENYVLGIAQNGQGAFWLGATNSPSPTLLFSNTSGQERMRIQDNGNVGINNGTPYNALSVTSSTGNPSSAATANQITICEATNNPDYRLNLGFFADTTWKGVVQATAGGPAGGVLLLQPNGGMCGVGTTTPLRALQVTGNANAGPGFGGGVALMRIEGVGSYCEPMLEFHEWGNSAPIACIAAKNTAGGAGDLIFLTRTNGAGAAAARMAVLSNGGVRIGMNGNPYSAGDLSLCRDGAPTTGVLYFGNTPNKYLHYDGTNFQFNGGSLYVNGVLVTPGVLGCYVQKDAGAAGGPYAYLNFQSTGAYNWQVSGAGNAVSISWLATSDARVKESIRDLTGGLAFIGQLRPKEFRFNGLGNTVAGQRGVSLIAQELRAFSPASVETYRTKLRADDAGETDLLHYNPQEITMQLILAVQQLEARLKVLEGR